MQICLVKWEVVKKSPMIIWRERAHYQPPTRPSLKFFDNCFPEMTSRARISALKRFLFGSQGFSSWDLYEINSKIRFLRWALRKLRILSTQRKYHSNNLTFKIRLEIRIVKKTALVKLKLLYLGQWAIDKIFASK